MSDPVDIAEVQVPAKGRIFFSGADRSLVEEDEIELVSVGIDIGSSTTHLMLSRITLERNDTRYVVAGREVLYASDILLTPYTAKNDIDTGQLSAFFEGQYAKSGIAREEIDTGALILTGVAVRRRNARAIADLFSSEAGKFVSVSAGDYLETVMSAHGAGAVAASRGGKRILNIDVGGGTTKLALCENGQIRDLTAIEAGARLVVADASGQIVRLERYGRLALGPEADIGRPLTSESKIELAELLADRIMTAIDGDLGSEYRRLDQLAPIGDLDGVVVAGGVSEYLFGDTSQCFGDIGPQLARALRQRLEKRDYPILRQQGGIRATVVGASQYKVQVSGSTVYIDPLDMLPVKNVATIRPDLTLSEDIDSSAVAEAVETQLRLFNLDGGDRPVAAAIDWQGSAGFHRIDALARGLIQGLAPILAAGHPLVLVMNGDIGGLFGIHCRENGLTENAVISIDGIDLEAFDFIDIGEVLRATGSVPVVIKSLVFPAEQDAEKREFVA